MIWPFKPHAPLGLVAKVNCERRIATIGKLLGKQRIAESHAVMTPQDIDPIIASSEAEQLPVTLFNFIAGRMLPQCQLAVGWGSEESLTSDGRGQHYQLTYDNSQSLIGIAFHPVLATYPYRLAAVVANAAAEYLIRSESLAENVAIGTFEVTPLLYGLGPIMANAALHENAEEASGIQSWEMSRIGTVSPLEFGYSMAICDWSLGTEYHDVKTLLRPDAKEGIEKGVRFLKKTADCCFEQDFMERATDQTMGFLKSRLDSRSDSVQLNTLLDLYRSEQIDADLLPDLARLLGHSEVEIQKLATATIGRCDSLPEPIHDELLILAQNSPVAVRRAAVSTLRPGYDNDEQITETLTELLRRGDAIMAASCIRTLLKYEAYPEHLPESLMSGLSTMVLASGNDDLLIGIELLRKIDSDPASTIQQHFEDDPSALAIFNELME